MKFLLFVFLPTIDQIVAILGLKTTTYGRYYWHKTNKQKQKN